MTEYIEPDPMNLERLPSGTLLEDLGCPHCAKTCDVCVTQDEIWDDMRTKVLEVIKVMESYRDPESASASKLHHYARQLRGALNGR